MIIAKINVTKIDKTKLFKGEKGTYLDVCLIETPNGQYGDFMVTQSISAEERKAGNKGAILGNAKWTGQSKPATPAPAAAPAPSAPPSENLDEDVPF